MAARDSLDSLAPPLRRNVAAIAHADRFWIARTKSAGLGWSWLTGSRGNSARLQNLPQGSCGSQASRRKLARSAAAHRSFDDEGGKITGGS